VKTDFRPARIRILIRGGGDLASGVAWRLHHCGFRVLITEVPEPLSVRRKVSFCEAVFDGSAEVEGVKAVLVGSVREVPGPWERGEIPVLVDPECRTKEPLRPEALVDAIIAKKNLGTSVQDAPLVIALGPGFEVGKDAHFVVETNRGHRLGRLLTSGSAEPDTGVPGPVKGITSDRVLRAPAEGLWENVLDIGDLVSPGDLIGTVDGLPVKAVIGGVIRGLIHRGVQVREGLKIGDIDPRGNVADCFTISDKALAIAGGVLEGILRRYGRLHI
jgi:xanthine dehydrogenase accessory factor